MSKQKLNDYSLFEKMMGHKWCWIPLFLALGLLFSCLQPCRLVEGGEVTILSILLVYLIAYCYGGFHGMLWAVVFGFLRFCVDLFLTEFVDKDHILAEIWDYLLGYFVIGIAGFVVEKRYRDNKENERNTLIIGYAIAAGLHYIEGVWNCAYFYRETLLHSILYTLSYIGVEALLTIAIIYFVTPFQESLIYIRKIATTKYHRNLDSF